MTPFNEENCDYIFVLTIKRRRRKHSWLLIKMEGRSLTESLRLCSRTFLWSSCLSSSNCLVLSSFWQQHAVLRETSTHTHTLPPPKKQQQTFALHTQNSTSFVLRSAYSKKRTKKQAKKSWQKVRQERWEKSLFLNLSCCCRETGLKPVMFLLFLT